MNHRRYYTRRFPPITKPLIKVMTRTTPVISLKLAMGGSYVGTPEQCLHFLSTYRDIVDDEYVIDAHFHWSETKNCYTHIKGMHPAYIRNALLKELRTLPPNTWQVFMEDVLSDYTLDHELVGDMYRLWCEMYDVGWENHRDALVIELVSSTMLEDILPSASLSVNHDPNASLSVNHDPNASLSVNHDPNASLNVNHDPSMVPSNNYPSDCEEDNI